MHVAILLPSTRARGIWPGATRHGHADGRIRLSARHDLRLQPCGIRASGDGQRRADRSTRGCGVRCAGPPTGRGDRRQTRPPCCSARGAPPSTSCWRSPAASATPGCVDAGRPGVVTYSKKVFIPLTRLCRDRCHYCTFATVPHRLDAPFLSRDEVVAIAAQGAALGLQGGAVHPRRPAGGAVGGGARVAGRGRLRLHAGLRPRLRDRRAGGDRPAAAPQPGRAVLGRPAAAEAGRAEHGDDAGDHRDPAVERAGRPALRFAGQGARGTAAGARRRRPGRRAVHHRHPHRHRRDAGRAGRFAVRDPARRPASTATSRKSSSRTSAPSRTRRCAACPTPNWTISPPRSRWPGSCSVPRMRIQAPPNLIDRASIRRCCCARRLSTTGAASRR